MTRLPAFALLILGGCAPSTTAVVPVTPPSDPLQPSVQALAAGEYDAAFDDLFRIVSDSCVAPDVRFQALLLAASADLDPRNDSGDPSRAAASIVELLAEGPPPRWAVPVVETLYLMAVHLGATPPEPRARSVSIRNPARLMPNSADVMPDSAEVVADSVHVPMTASEAAEDSEVEEEPPGTSRPRRVLDAIRSAFSRDSVDPDPEAVAEPTPCFEREGASADVVLPELPITPLVLRIARLEAERSRMSRSGEELEEEIARLEEELERIRRTLVP